MQDFGGCELSGVGDAHGFGGILEDVFALADVLAGAFFHRVDVVEVAGEFFFPCSGGEDVGVALELECLFDGVCFVYRVKEDGYVFAVDHATPAPFVSVAV